MVGKALSISFMPGMFLGLVYLFTIMWWLTGHTPMDLVNGITDVITRPFSHIAEALRSNHGI